MADINSADAAQIARHIESSPGLLALGKGSGY